MTDQVISIPLNKLVLSSTNMRKADASYQSLVPDIVASKGVLQNLLVHVQVDEAGAETGLFEVHAGGRRLRALQWLAKSKSHKEFKADHPVPCKVRPREAVAFDTFSENEHHLPPHHADRYEVFKQLLGTGVTGEEIANRYGYTMERLAKLMKLAKVSPKIMQLFRDDKINLQHVEALTLSEDHAAQEAALMDGDRIRQPQSIRNFITSSAVSAADDRRAKFVGEDAYAAAGGIVTRDLFGGNLFFNDPALLDQLALAALNEHAAALAPEGWAWVEVMLEADWRTFERFKRVYPSPLPVSDEDQAKLDELETKLEQIDWDSEDGDPEAEHAAIEAQIEALSAGEGYNEDDKEFAGMLLHLGYNGDVKIERGLIKAEDKAAHTAMERARKGLPAVEPTITHGGKQKREDGLSAALVEDLTAHRTVALRAALIESPRVGLIAAVHTLLVQAHYGEHSDSKRAVMLSFANAYSIDVARYDDVKGSTALAALAERQMAAGAGLPEDLDDLWPYLEGLTDEELIKLLAYGVSYGVYAVQKAHSTSCTNTVEYMADALKLDMTAHWAPTPARFLGRVRKSVIVDVVREVHGDTKADMIGKLKTVEAVERADGLLKDSGWLPAVLRNGKPKRTSASKAAEEAAQRDARAALAMAISTTAADEDAPALEDA